MRVTLAAAGLAAGFFASAADGMPAQPAAARTGSEIVQNTCILCHGTGVGGAPRARSTREWRPRLRQGMDGLVRSAAAGKGAMPVRGGMPDLTDEELRAAILYLTGLDEAGER